MADLTRNAVPAPAQHDPLPAGGEGTVVRMVEAVAALNGVGGPDHVAEALCASVAGLLVLDAAWVVRRAGTGVAVDAAWARPGGVPSRIGLSRLAEVAHRWELAGAPAVEHHWAGRHSLVAAPLVGAGAEPPRLLVGAARVPRVFVDAELELVRLLAGHAGARIDPPGGRPAGSGLPPRPDRLEFLRSLSGGLARARSEVEVGHAVVTELREVIDYRSCCFSIVASGGGVLLPVVHLQRDGGGDDAWREDLICRVGEGIAGRAFVDRAAVRIDDATAEAAVPGEEPPDGSLLVAAMVVDGDPIGVITVSKEGRHAFDDDDLRLLEVSAAQAAAACANARLYTRLKESAELSEALLELGAALAVQTSVDGIVDMLARAVERLVECAGLSVWLRQADELVPGAMVGYMPRERRRIGEARLRATAEPFRSALQRRSVRVLGVEEAPTLASCLDAAPAGTTFSIVAVGERAANRAAIVVQRGPRRGAPGERDRQVLTGIADQALPALANRALYDQLEHSFLATVQALGNALDTKDRYTGDHAQALIGLCTDVAERMGVADDCLRDIHFAAALHDIGKIGIPARILQKPGPLTDEEFEVMKQHPELGARIIEPVAALDGARRLVLACHEHWDGSGYPLELRGEAIPFGSRVILACDAFHAMTSDRVYRDAMSPDEAIAELRRCAGSHFDPGVVDALVAVITAGATVG